jgi:hypothetical protein
VSARLEPPRYTSTPLPAYRYLPGRSPHPRRDPAGHSYGTPEPKAAAWTPEQWPRLSHWLFGVDLFNHTYWWEAHEQHEALWHAAGRTSEHARFVRGLIKVAAACLNFELGKNDVARAQALAGTAALLASPLTADGTYMGADVRGFAIGVSDWFSVTGTPAPLLILRAGV